MLTKISYKFSKDNLQKRNVHFKNTLIFCQNLKLDQATFTSQSDLQHAEEERNLIELLKDNRTEEAVNLLDQMSVDKAAIVLTQEIEGSKPIDHALINNARAVEAMIKKIKCRPEALVKMLGSSDSKASAQDTQVVEVNPEVVRVITRELKDQPDILEKVFGTSGPLFQFNYEVFPINRAIIANPAASIAMTDELQDNPELLAKILKKHNSLDYAMDHNLETFIVLVHALQTSPEILVNTLTEGKYPSIKKAISQNPEALNIILEELHDKDEFLLKLLTPEVVFFAMTPVNIKSLTVIVKNLKDKPEILETIFKKRKDTLHCKTESPLHNVSKFWNSAAINIIIKTFQDRPDILAEILTDKGRYNAMPIHISILSGDYVSTKAMIDAVKGKDDQTLYKMMQSLPNISWDEYLEMTDIKYLMDKADRACLSFFLFGDPNFSASFSKPTIKMNTKLTPEIRALLERTFLYLMSIGNEIHALPWKK